MGGRGEPLGDLLLVGVGVGGLREQSLRGLDSIGLFGDVVWGVGAEEGDQARVEGGAGHCEGALEKVDGDWSARGKERSCCEGCSGS